MKVEVMQDMDDIEIPRVKGTIFVKVKGCDPQLFFGKSREGAVHVVQSTERIKSQSKVRLNLQWWKKEEYVLGK